MEEGKYFKKNVWWRRRRREESWRLSWSHGGQDGRHICDVIEAKPNLRPKTSDQDGDTGRASDRMVKSEIKRECEMAKNKTLVSPGRRLNVTRL